MFEATPEQTEDMVASMQLEAPKTPPNADDLKFLAFWKTFSVSVKEPTLNIGLKNVAGKFFTSDMFEPTNYFDTQGFSSKKH